MTFWFSFLGRKFLPHLFLPRRMTLGIYTRIEPPLRPLGCSAHWLPCMLYLRIPVYHIVQVPLTRWGWGVIRAPAHVTRYVGAGQGQGWAGWAMMYGLITPLVHNASGWSTTAGGATPIGVIDVALTHAKGGDWCNHPLHRALANSPWGLQHGEVTKTRRGMSGGAHVKSRDWTMSYECICYMSDCMKNLVTYMRSKHGCCIDFFVSPDVNHACLLICEWKALIYFLFAMLYSFYNILRRLIRCKKRFICNHACRHVKTDVYLWKITIK